MTTWTMYSTPQQRQFKRGGQHTLEGFLYYFCVLQLLCFRQVTLSMCTSAIKIKRMRAVIKANLHLFFMRQHIFKNVRRSAIRCLVVKV